MREIKFRAWDTIYKYMVEVEQIVFTEGKTFIYYLQHDQWERSALKNVELLQFTGLKDKNGKEIYEGDVVVWYEPLDDGEGVESGEIGEIIFHDASFKFNKEIIGKYMDRYPEAMDVIGNIYDNPELLEEVK